MADIYLAIIVLSDGQIFQTDGEHRSITSAFSNPFNAKELEEKR
jgi:hypothetical protein